MDTCVLTVSNGSLANIHGPCFLLVTDTLHGAAALSMSPGSRSITHRTQARFDTSVC